ncbi:PorT family protein [Paracrocinitomix mangrovi]|uniref:outer membrane beta-barrel protein n=1 Tax=Paracrocinitomix mangrovi TaxID=2862509 RepID=UPI001C8E12A8|nr:outer membrane beta-barrel protein [Paracrocinitomix mangrovi]UKN03658.1 PorT family protein [Paracrocinitomix mangrovi]
MQSNNTQAGSLKDKFQDYGAAPSEALWGDIEAALDGGERKKRGAFWWWFSGVSLAMTAVILFVVNIDQGSNDHLANNNSNESSLVDVDENQEESISNNDTSKDIVEENEILVDEVKSANQQSSSVQSTKSVIAKNEYVPFENVEKVEHDVISSSDFIAKLPNQRVGLLQNIFQYPQMQPIEEFTPKVNRPWEVGFEFGYYNDVDQFFNPQEEMINTVVPPLNTYADAAIMNGNELALYNGQVRSTMFVRGFVGRYFSNRFAWRTGLDFGQTKYVSQLNQVENFQTTLSSVGIPFSVKFDAIQKKNFRWRFEGGVITELPIHQSVSFQSDLAQEATKSSSVGIGYRGALKLGTSLDFRIKNTLHMHISPAYRWYFYQTYPSQVPLLDRKHWVGGTVGLSWYF